MNSISSFYKKKSIRLKTRKYLTQRKIEVIYCNHLNWFMIYSRNSGIGFYFMSTNYIEKKLSDFFMPIYFFLFSHKVHICNIYIIHI